jgi:hypothetical protein
VAKDDGKSFEGHMAMKARMGRNTCSSLAVMARSGMWPTPSVCGNYNRKGASATSGDGLATVVQMWPTPDASMGTGGRVSASYPTGTRPSGSKQAITLNNAVKWWPTPTADAASNRTTKYAQGGTPLTMAVQMWPTPTAVTDTGGAALCKWGGAGARAKLRTMVTPQELNGALNPDWVEALMGLPPGYTDLGDRTGKTASRE